MGAEPLDYELDIADTLRSAGSEGRGRGAARGGGGGSRGALPPTRAAPCYADAERRGEMCVRTRGLDMRAALAPPTFSGMRARDVCNRLARDGRHSGWNEMAASPRALARAQGPRRSTAAS
jgi:hypothetical protein